MKSPKSLTRSYSPRPAGSLEQATDSLIAANGPRKFVAGLVRVRETQLIRYTDPGEIAAMPADIIRSLEALCGDPIVTRYLAAESGHVLLRLAPEGEGALDALTADAARDFGELIAGLVEARADGHIDDREAGEAIERIDQMLTDLTGLREQLQTIRDGDEK